LPDQETCGGHRNQKKKEEVITVRLINLTPHPVNLLLEGRTITVPPEGVVARVREEILPDTGIVLDGGVEIPVVRKVLREVVGLPEPSEGVFFIVSLAVAQAARDREDLLIPDDFVRDEEGRIVGARRLSRLR
jgi:hypothetical protein